MQYHFSAEEWNALLPAERLQCCSLRTEEALSLAANAQDHHKEAYILIAKGWLKLAGAIEQEMRSIP